MAVLVERPPQEVKFTRLRAHEPPVRTRFVLPATPLSSDVRQKGLPMRAPFLPPDADGALDTACRDVEGEVSRLAKLVLHASALADRMDATAVVEATSLRHSERVQVLRQAADAGREAISRTAAAAWSASSAPVIGAQQQR